MAYTDAFRAYLRTHRAVTIPVLEIEWPDLTRTYTSSGGAGVAAEGRVVEAGWGAIPRGIAPDSSDLTPLETTVQLANTDRAIEQLLEGQYVCRGVPVRLYRATPDLDSSHWPTIFTGILSSWAYQPGAVTLTLRSDDRPLQGFVPKVSFSETHFQLRNHTAGSEGLWAPLLFGNHDSSGLTGTGMVPLIPVDWSSGVAATYCVCLGTAVDVPTIYNNGVSVASGWTASSGNYGGVNFTIVDFSSGFPAADDVLTADVEGYDADGSGAGSLITNPVHQLWLFLDQFVWSDQRSWDTSTWGYNKGNAPVDATSWEAMAEKFTLYSIRGARRIGGDSDRVRAIDVVNEWLESFPFVRLHWDAEGNLKMSDVLPDHPGYGTSTDRIVAEHEEVSGGMRLSYDDSAVTRRVSVQCLYSSADREYVGSVDVQDLGVDEDVTDELSCVWYEGSG